MHPHSYSFFSSTEFSVCLLTSNTESRAEDDEAGVAVVEELVDESRTLHDTKFDLQSILLPPSVECGFLIAGPVVSIPMIPEEIPEKKNGQTFFEKHNRDDKVQIFGVCRGFFSCLHAVGSHHRRRTFLPFRSDVVFDPVVRAFHANPTSFQNWSFHTSVF